MNIIAVMPYDLRKNVKLSIAFTSRIHDNRNKERYKNINCKFIILSKKNIIKK